MSPLGWEGQSVGLVTHVCSLSQKPQCSRLNGWGNHRDLSTSLGSGPGDQALRAAGQEGGVPLSLNK